MKLAYIPPGEFMMGSRDSAEEVARKVGEDIEPKSFKDEHPQHRVKITKGFYMGTTEVTQLQYEKVMNDNPSYFKGYNNPVEAVAWQDAVEFCRRLSEKEGETYRLPTEAEWEYACRAGSTTPFCTGETISPNQANYLGTYVYGNGNKGIWRVKTTPVGSFSRNNFGLYDMHGNVQEWCQDRYDGSYYAASPVPNPQGPSSGMYRVLRGGYWYAPPWNCRSAARYSIKNHSRSIYQGGFRVILELN